MTRYPHNQQIARVQPGLCFPDRVANKLLALQTHPIGCSQRDNCLINLLAYAGNRLTSNKPGRSCNERAHLQFESAANRKRRLNTPQRCHAAWHWLIASYQYNNLAIRKGAARYQNRFIGISQRFIQQSTPPAETAVPTSALVRDYQPSPLFGRGVC